MGARPIRAPFLQSARRHQATPFIPVGTYESVGWKINTVRAREESILAVAEIVRDSAAMNQAALAGDLDEARSLAFLVASKAEVAGLATLALAADDLVLILGPPASKPNSDFGAVMLRAANEEERRGSRNRLVSRPLRGGRL